MSIEDFTRPWVVSNSGVQECSFDDKIEITVTKIGEPGEPVKVQVTCKRGDPKGDFIYPEGMYDELTNTITGVDGSYEIQLQIKFSSLVGQGGITGSWTANDTTGGVDGGE